MEETTDVKSYDDFIEEVEEYSENELNLRENIAIEKLLKNTVRLEVKAGEWDESCVSKFDEFYKGKKEDIKRLSEEERKEALEKITTAAKNEISKTKSLEEVRQILDKAEDEKRKIINDEDTCVFITNAALAPELEKGKNKCVIAVNEPANENTIKDELKRKLGDDVQKVPFNTILIFDDVKEKGTVEIITKVLKDLGKEYISYPANLYKKRKENKRAVILIEDDEDQADTLAKKASCLEDIEGRLEYTNDSTHTDKFLETIENSANAPAIKTGFNNFDEALGGGLRSGRLYGIGAISSIGKTTFALQIADNIARRKQTEEAQQDVLIISLEMSRHELIGKSISRGTAIISSKKQEDSYKDNGNVYLAKDNKAIPLHVILDYKKLDALPEENRKIFHEAIDDYHTNIAPHRYISEGVGDIGSKHVKELVEDFYLTKRSRPVVIIDYLQILAPYSDKMTDKQNIDKNVLELKRICRDYQVPIIIINSFNRTNYLQEASFESFKESGAIEYSCDVLIALQLGIEGKEDWTDKHPSINEKRKKINEAKLKNPRDIEVIILKNRGYKAYDKIAFKYYPQFDLFEEGEKPEAAGNRNPNATTRKITVAGSNPKLIE